MDNSGPVSIDIPPGTYTGVQLADAAEVALRDAFGDDKMVQLTAGVDNTFSIDFKKASGDGKSTGLPSPIVVDLHDGSIVTATPENGMTMDAFLSHAQRLITKELNAYIQDPADSDGVDATKVNNIGADGKIRSIIHQVAAKYQPLYNQCDLPHNLPLMPQGIHQN